MRTNLNVPYAEKDKAKALGAKWDAARRVWYVENLPNLVPFLRWMPEHLRRPVKTASKPARKAVKKPEKKTKKCNRIRKPTVRTDFSMFDPGCSCVPWEWCEHNPAPDVPIMSDQLEHIRSIMAE